MSSAFSATRWVLAGSIGFRIIAFLGQWLILRMVDKEVFGAYRGLVAIHLMVMTMLPLGMDMLYVRERSRRRRYALGLSVALAATGSLFLLLGVAAACLPSPDPAQGIGAYLLDLHGQAPALLLMPAIFGVQAAKLLVRSKLSAELDFRKISIAEFGNGLVTWLGGAAVVLVWPEAWALMAAYLAGEVLELVAMSRGERFRFRRVLSPARWTTVGRLMRRHASFLVYNAADLTVNQVAAQMPAVLLMAWVSKEAGADFGVAGTLVILPVMLLVGAIYRVAFPVIAGVAEDELHRRCLAILGATAAFIAPVVIWLAFFSHSTVMVLGGSRYLSAAPMVQWMSIYMFMTAIFSPISSLDVVRDKPQVGLWWNLVHLGTRVAVLKVFAADGALAAVAAMGIASGALWVVWAAMLGGLLRAGATRYWGAVGRFVPAWVVLAGGCWMAGEATGWHLLWAPVASLPACALYAGLVLRFHPAEAALLKRLATVRRRSPGA